jgi:hypothetical protein
LSENHLHGNSGLGTRPRGDGSPGYTFAQPAVGAPPRLNDYSLSYTGPGAYEFGDRRIDYVFTRDGASRSAVWESSKVVFDGKGAEWVFGHYGVFADLRPVPEPSAALLALASLGVLGTIAGLFQAADAGIAGTSGLSRTDEMRSVKIRPAGTAGRHRAAAAGPNAIGEESRDERTKDHTGGCRGHVVRAGHGERRGAHAVPGR